MKHNWEYKTLGEVCKLSAGGDKPVETSKEKTLTNMIPVYSNGIENDGLYGYCSKAKVFNNALTISGRGTIGYPSIKREPFVPIIRLIVAEPNDSIKLDYLYYWVYNRRFSGNGAAIPQLTVPMIKNEIIPVPSMEMQKQIVAELDKINEIIKDCKEAIRNLNSLTQSLFYDFFGDPITNPKGWEEKLLKSICSLKAGKAISSEELITTYHSGLFPCYGGNGIRGFISRYSNIGPLNIIGRQGALCGNISLSLGNFYATEHAIVVTPNYSMNHYWLYHTLSNLNLNRFAKGVAQPGLSVSVIGEVRVIFPPLALQERFASRIEQIEQQKKDLEETIVNMQTLLNCRMDYWFN